MKTRLETLIEEAKLQAEEHPSKDARWFANSVHEYLTQRKPLTDELLDAYHHWRDNRAAHNKYIDTVEAIKAAHGIKE